MEKIIVITSDDTIETRDYSGYESLSEGVKGRIEYLTVLKDMPLGLQKRNIDVICNEEYLYLEDESCLKVNPIATYLNNGRLVFGNVVLAISLPDGENKGFDYIEAEDGDEDICECWFMEDTLLRLKQHLDHEGYIKDCHEKFDNNRPEIETPKVIPFDEFDDFFGEDK